MATAGRGGLRATHLGVGTREHRQTTQPRDVQAHCCVRPHSYSQVSNSRAAAQAFALHLSCAPWHSVKMEKSDPYGIKLNYLLNLYSLSFLESYTFTTKNSAFTLCRDTSDRVGSKLRQMVRRKMKTFSAASIHEMGSSLGHTSIHDANTSWSV